MILIWIPQAFPPGLRMITGDPRRRSKKYAVGLGTQAELRERAVQWSCLRYSANQPGYGQLNCSV
jgi:hypothetical protein